MPLFMDFHKLENITVDEVLKAHMADVSIQDKYGVKYHQFWVNQKEGTVFCLTEGPDAETCELVHQMAHGNMPCAITEVEPGFLKLVMGERHVIDHGLTRSEDGTVDAGYRSVLVASVRGITSARNTADLDLLQVPVWAKESVKRRIAEHNGRLRSWAVDDTFIAVFNNTDEAMRCAGKVRTDLMNRTNESPTLFKIGISTDQPLNTNGEFFDNAIKLAHRLCTSAGDNEILVSSLARKFYSGVDDSAHTRFLDSNEEEFLSSVVRTSEDNLSRDDFNVESLCRSIGISRPQLYRKLTALTGRAPNYFLRDLRMEKALSLLREKKKNISEIALEVGYNNPSYFSRCFADKFGCVPSQVN